MTAPGLHTVDPRVSEPRPVPWWRFPATRRALRRARLRLLGPARMLPGLAAAGCAFAGSWLLWNLGTALLVAVPFLLAVDARTPRA